MSDIVPIVEANTNPVEKVEIPEVIIERNENIQEVTKFPLEIPERKQSSGESVPPNGIDDEAVETISLTSFLDTKLYDGEGCLDSETPTSVGTPDLSIDSNTQKDLLKAATFQEKRISLSWDNAEDHEDKKKKRLSLDKISVTRIFEYTQDLKQLEMERPSHLPPKSKSEKQSIDREIAKLNARVKAKIKIEEKEKNIKKQQQVEKEEFIRSSTKIWEKDIIPDWENKKNDKKTLQLWKNAVPPKVRGDVWKLAIGNVLCITPDLFKILSDKKVIKKEENNSGEEDVNREGTIDLITIDLARTFPQLKFFQVGGPLYQPMKQVLECYVKYRPDVGYVQGMSYLVAMLLLYMDTYSAFVALANMINANHFYSFFRMNTQQIFVHVEIIKLLLKEFMPDLHANFERQGVKHQIFVLDWFITLFSKSFSVDIAARLWDRYFLEGEIFLYRGTLGVLQYFSPKLKTAPFEDCMQFLSHIPRDLDEDNLFYCIDEIAITKQLLQKCKKDAEKVVLTYYNQQ